MRHVSEVQLRNNLARRQAFASGHLQEPSLTADLPSWLDALQVSRLFWGDGITNFAGGIRGVRFLEIGGTHCLVFGPEVAALPHAPTVVIFRGRCQDVVSEMSQVAQAYVANADMRVVLPLAMPKTSLVLKQARALIAGLPSELASGPLVVHGVYTGSIPAIQVAAESSLSGTRCCHLLILENGISSFSQIHGAVG